MHHLGRSPGAHPIQQFGGTSESSPLTAGAAALVIQAYRSTHHGASPSPALVKEILMSTATDLGAPPSEQGAGFINALAAVNAALGTGTGSGLLNNPSSATIDDLPGTPETVSVAITNTGAAGQRLEPTLEALGPAFARHDRTLTLIRRRSPRSRTSPARRIRPSAHVRRAGGCAAPRHGDRV